MDSNYLASKISALPLELQQVLLKYPGILGLIKELAEDNERLRHENEILRHENENMRREIEELWDEVKRLRGQLNLDSHNSNKPPSTDQNRVKSKGSIGSFRNSSDKKPGGQEGHPGTTLKAVSIQIILFHI